MAAPIVIVIVSSFNPNAYGAWPPSGVTLALVSQSARQRRVPAGLRQFARRRGDRLGLTVLLGAPIAYALSRFALPGAGVLRALVLAPLVVPRVALGFGLFALYLLTRSGLYGTLAGHGARASHR